MGIEKKVVGNKILYVDKVNLVAFTATDMKNARARYLKEKAKEDAKIITGGN